MIFLNLFVLLFNLQKPIGIYRIVIVIEPTKVARLRLILRATLVMYYFGKEVPLQGSLATRIDALAIFVGGVIKYPYSSPKSITILTRLLMTA